MIVRYDIEQNSPEWFEAKWRRIGGTLSKGLLIKTDTLLIDMLSQHLEDCEIESDSYQSASMERGSEMEPFAIQYLEQYTGLKFGKPGICISEENDLLCSSPDGLTECEEYGAETKCLGRKNHTKILFDNEVPLEHIPQLVHYFTVNPKLKKMYWLAFRPESIKHFLKEFTLDTEVNMGTKAKPVIKPISHWVAISKHEAKILKAEIDTHLQILNRA